MKTTLAIIALAAFIVVSFTSAVLHSQDRMAWSVNETVNKSINTTHERYIYDVARDTAARYTEAHTYMRGVYDCDDMSFDLWNQLVTEGLPAKIMTGNPQEDYKTAGMNHAWVVVEVAPDQWIGVESTGGYISTSKNYMRGVIFDTPKDAMLWAEYGGSGLTMNFGDGKTESFTGTEVELTPYTPRWGIV